VTKLSERIVEDSEARSEEQAWRATEPKRLFDGTLYGPYFLQIQEPMGAHGGARNPPGWTMIGSEGAGSNLFEFDLADAAGSTVTSAFGLL
jgi:hypothetical protein